MHSTNILLATNFVVAGGQFQFHEMTSNTPYDAIAAEFQNLVLLTLYLTGGP
jgi:vitamin B12 transporter